MAEEEKTEEVPQKSSGGGKGLMIALIAVVVILLLAVIGGGYFMYSQGMFNGAQQTQIQEVEESQEEEESSKASYTADFKDIVLNITKNSGRNALMKLSFTIKSKEETIEARSVENAAEIMDAVISIISTKTAEELRTLGGKEILKEEMIIAINDILNENINEDNEDASIKDGIEKLFFVNFVIK